MQTRVGIVVLLSVRSQGVRQASSSDLRVRSWTSVLSGYKEILTVIVLFIDDRRPPDAGDVKTGLGLGLVRAPQFLDDVSLCGHQSGHVIAVRTACIVVGVRSSDTQAVFDIRELSDEISDRTGSQVTHAGVLPLVGISSAKDLSSLAPARFARSVGVAASLCS